MMSVVLKLFKVQGGGVGTDEKKERGETDLKHQLRIVLQAQQIFQEEISLSSFLLLRMMDFQKPKVSVLQPIQTMEQASLLVPRTAGPG